jgi:hypothetical protein
MRQRRRRSSKAVRDNQGADESNPLPHEDAATRGHRDGARRPRLLSRAPHVHHGVRRAACGDTDIDREAATVSTVTRPKTSRLRARARPSGKQPELAERPAKPLWIERKLPGFSHGVFAQPESGAAVPARRQRGRSTSINGPPPREPSGLLGAESTTLFQIPDLGSFRAGRGSQSEESGTGAPVSRCRSREGVSENDERRLDQPGSVRLVVQHLGRRRPANGDPTRLA